MAFTVCVAAEGAGIQLRNYFVKLAEQRRWNGAENEEGAITKINWQHEDFDLQPHGNRRHRATRENYIPKSGTFLKWIWNEKLSSLTLRHLWHLARNDFPFVFLRHVWHLARMDRFTQRFHRLSSVTWQRTRKLPRETFKGFTLTAKFIAPGRVWALKIPKIHLRVTYFACSRHDTSSWQHGCTVWRRTRRRGVGVWGGRSLCRHIFDWPGFSYM